jgi:ribosomal-protein-alanine N-acetyltransferase
MDSIRHTPRLDLIPLSKIQLKWTLDSPLRQAQGSANPLEENLGIQFDTAIIDENLIRAIGMKLEKMAKLPVEKHIWQTYWLIVERKAQVGIGLAGFKFPPDDEGLSEVGYGIAPAWHNRSYMSEALRGLLEWAFEQPDCLGITAMTVRNPASRRLLEKLGATLLEENEHESSWIFRKNDTAK